VETSLEHADERDLIEEGLLEKGGARGIIHDSFGLNRRGIAFRPAKQSAAARTSVSLRGAIGSALSSIVTRMSFAVVAEGRAA
jgi:hypothetical protein